MTSAIVDFATLITEPGYFKAIPDGYDGIHVSWIQEGGPVPYKIFPPPPHATGASGDWGQQRQDLDEIHQKQQEIPDKAKQMADLAIGTLASILREGEPQDQIEAAKIILRVSMGGIP
jgi:hypothetical protein